MQHLAVGSQDSETHDPAEEFVHFKDRVLKILFKNRSGRVNRLGT